MEDGRPEEQNGIRKIFVKSTIKSSSALGFGMMMATITYGTMQEEKRFIFRQLRTCAYQQGRRPQRRCPTTSESMPLHPYLCDRPETMYGTNVTSISVAVSRLDRCFGFPVVYFT
jgi:hypothetical protein